MEVIDKTKEVKIEKHEDYVMAHDDLRKAYYAGGESSERYRHLNKELDRYEDRKRQEGLSKSITKDERRRDDVIIRDTAIKMFDKGEIDRGEARSFIRQMEKQYENR